MVVMLALRVGAWWPPVGARESGIKVQDLGFSHDGMGWQRTGPEGSQVKGCGSRIVDLTPSLFLQNILKMSSSGMSVRVLSHRVDGESEEDNGGGCDWP